MYREHNEHEHSDEDFTSGNYGVRCLCYCKCAIPCGVLQMYVHLQFGGMSAHNALRVMRDIIWSR